MPTSEDYFQNISAIDPGKRKMTRLANNRVLKSIASKRSGYELNWTTGKISFMKSYKTKIFPGWFAKNGENVHIQVSIRLIPGAAHKESPVDGLKGMEVYYRFLKIIAVIDKGTEKEDLPEEERTEFQKFSTGRDIIEATEWMGSSLSISQTANLYYSLIKSIGIEKVKRVLKRASAKK